MALTPPFSPSVVLINTNKMVEFSFHLHERRRRVTLVHSKTLPTRPESSSFSMAKADNNNNMKKKSVRFHEEQLEQVRFFLRTQTPSAIRDGDPSAPLSAMTIDLKYPNWPEKTVIRSTPNMIRMENVQATRNSNANAITLVGRCRVANLAFQKHVVVRYTTDYWQSFHETEAMYREPIGSSANTWDRFSFQIELEQAYQAHAITTLYLALRYTVNNADYWDNNDGLNYQIDILVHDNAAVDEETQWQYQEEEEQMMISDHSQQKPVDQAQQGQKESKRKEKTLPAGAVAAAAAGLVPVSPPPATKASPKIISKTRLSPPALMIEPPKHVVVAKKKKLGMRYDFSASLSAAKKVVSYPPTSEEMRYQHPFAGRPLYEQQQQQQQPKSVAHAAETGDDDDVLQLRYRDIIAKYCFYGNTTAPSPSLSSCPSPEPICG